jgi:hypothetical protein
VARWAGPKAGAATTAHSPSETVSSRKCGDGSGRDRFAETARSCPRSSAADPIRDSSSCSKGCPPRALCEASWTGGAWQSPLLTARARTRTAEVEETLAHLGSGSLDALETVIVPFARETIRYRPVQVQRRARDLSGSLDDAQLVELIGVTALANAVCRLSLAVEPP